MQDKFDNRMKVLLAQQRIGAVQSKAIEAADAELRAAALPSYGELRTALASALRQLPVHQVAKFLPVLERSGGAL